MSEKKCRIRRGKLVEIPEEWVGKTPHKQTIRKRQSKQTKKNINESCRLCEKEEFLYEEENRILLR